MIGFVVGTLLGAVVTAVVLSLCRAAADAEDYEGEHFKEEIEE